MLTVMATGKVPLYVAVLLLAMLACLGVFGLAASDDLALIALFLQITTVASYILVGIDKQNQRSTEGAVKFFLFSAAAGVVGDQTLSGALNGHGTLLVRVTVVGEESFLRQVIRSVEDARALKPGLLHLVDRVLRVYTPFVGRGLLDASRPRHFLQQPHDRSSALGMTLATGRPAQCPAAA